MKIVKVTLIGIFLSLGISSFAVDRVDNVYLCGDDVGIYLSNGNWLVAKKSDLGNNEKRVDRMLTLASLLLTAQLPIGYYNNIGTTSWCGIQNAQRINVLQAKSN